MDEPSATRTATGEEARYYGEVPPLRVAHFDGAKWAVDTTFNAFILSTVGGYYAPSGLAIYGTSAGDFYVTDSEGSMFHHTAAGTTP
jgi:hypothetical protein